MHIVPQSPWPLLTAATVMFLLMSVVNFFWYCTITNYYEILSICLIILLYVFLITDVSFFLENVLLQMYMVLFQRSFGLVFFLLIEAVFFFLFFWYHFYSSNSLSVFDSLCWISRIVSTLTILALVFVLLFYIFWLLSKNWCSSKYTSTAIPLTIKTDGFTSKVSVVMGRSYSTGKGTNKISEEEEDRNRGKKETNFIGVCYWFFGVISLVIVVAAVALVFLFPKDLVMLAAMLFKVHLNTCVLTNRYFLQLVELSFVVCGFIFVILPLLFYNSLSLAVTPSLKNRFDCYFFLSTNVMFLFLYGFSFCVVFYGAYAALTGPESLDVFSNIRVFRYELLRSWALTKLVIIAHCLTIIRSIVICLNTAGGFDALPTVYWWYVILVLLLLLMNTGFMFDGLERLVLLEAEAPFSNDRVGTPTVKRGWWLEHLAILEPHPITMDISAGPTFNRLGWYITYPCVLPVVVVGHSLEPLLRQSTPFYVKRSPSASARIFFVIIAAAVFAVSISGISASSSWLSAAANVSNLKSITELKFQDTDILTGHYKCFLLLNFYFVLYFIDRNVRVSFEWNETLTFLLLFTILTLFWSGTFLYLLGTGSMKLLIAQLGVKLHVPFFLASLFVVFIKTYLMLNKILRLAYYNWLSVMSWFTLTLSNVFLLSALYNYLITLDRMAGWTLRQHAADAFILDSNLVFFFLVVALIFFLCVVVSALMYRIPYNTSN